MDFDPALEAQAALQRCRDCGELGERLEEAEALESTFSSSAGPEATDAYRRLIELGAACPQARGFREFLIYITWQQVTEHTVPVYFREGARLCDEFLSGRDESMTARTLAQVQSLRRSFRNGLGLTDEDDLDEEYNRDSFKGGD